jgi:hypothetical protein
MAFTARSAQLAFGYQVERDGEGSLGMKAFLTLDNEEGKYFINFHRCLG